MKFRNSVLGFLRTGGERKDRNDLFPALTFRARIFAALVGISAVTSLVIGLVLYSFAEDRLVEAESDLLVQRSRTANEGASDFLEGLRDPEDGTIPAPDTYAEELVRSVADPTGLGVIYMGPEGRPLAARDGRGDSLDSQETYESLGIEDGVVRSALGDAGRGGKLVSGGDLRYVTVWPVSAADGTTRGVMIYTTSQAGLDNTLAYLRYGILGAILTSILLAALGSLLLTRQLTRPLSETRDAAIRIATGDYGTTVPVTGRDELGEVARAFNYMAEEIEHYVGEIRAQKSRLEAVLEATPDAIVATDTGERITMANPAAARLLGILPSDSGRFLENVGVHEEVLSCVREAAAAGVAVREFEVEEKILWSYAARMGDGTGDVENVGTIITVRDTTDQRSLERAKTTFVSDVSHELRTPLTTVRLLTETLSRDLETASVPDRIRERVAKMDVETGHLVQMVNELLDLSRIESGETQLRLEPVDLGRVARSAIERVRTFAERQHVRLEPLLSGTSTPIIVRGDEERLGQLLINLLHNAVKFSPVQGVVAVEAHAHGGEAVVSVVDQGPGIPVSDIERVFERFYKVDRARVRGASGTGLGLSIARHIVEAHGGRIWAESEEGRGSTFRFAIPMAEAPLPR